MPLSSQKGNINVENSQRKQIMYFHQSHSWSFLALFSPTFQMLVRQSKKPCPNLN